MPIHLELPQGQFQLRRFPLRNNDLLQAWDAADVLLLRHLAKQTSFSMDQSIVILNDNFGALAVALSLWRPTSISDSFVSQQATLHNLHLNGLAIDQVQLLDSLALPPTNIDFVLIKIPKTLALLEDQLLRIKPMLSANTTFIAAGRVKNLPAAVWKLLETIIGPTTTSLAVKKAKLIFAKVDPTITLPACPYPSIYQLEDTDLLISNHANVFSRDKLDIGTRFLLQHLPNHTQYTDYIDLGCGNGIVGLLLAKNSAAARLKFVDESYMAIASARQNFQQAFGNLRDAEFIVDDGLNSLADESADCIVCNPPFHQQHAIGSQIAEHMFRHSHRVLRANGELRIIGNRHLNYHLSLKSIFRNYEMVASNNKFVIFNSFKR